MTQIIASCGECSQKYRVPDADLTYACKSCEGTVRVGSKAAPKRARKAASSKDGHGLVQRVLGALFPWLKVEESDEISGSTTLGDMDWDVFGADALEESDDLMKQPSLSRSRAELSSISEMPVASSSVVPAGQGAQGSRVQTPAPRVPAEEGFSSLADSDDTVRSAFDDFDWD